MLSFIVIFKGNVRITKATGTRIFFPPIEGIDVRVRQRYPIAPVHGEGSQVWKEVEALKDLVLKSKTNAYYFHEPLTSSAVDGNPPEPPANDTTLEITAARKTPPGPHEHFIELNAQEVSKINI